MWHLGSMRTMLRRALGIHLGTRLGIQAALGIGIGISSPAAPAQDLEPSCLAPPGAEEIRWTRGPETDRVHLDRWCAAVGPPLLRRAGEEALVPGADDLLVAVWNVQLGAGAVPTLVADLRAGRLTAGEPVRHFVLLLQEVHRDLVDGPASPPTGALTAPRIAPKQWGPDVLSVARDLGLHLLYVPSMRNGGGDQPAEDRGNAILSTLPLRDPWALELPLERQRRVAVAARVDFGSAKDGLLLVSAHLDNRSSWRAAFRSFGTGRTGQARWLVRALLGEPAVALGGDFNTWLRGTDARALSLLREGFPLPKAPLQRPTLIIPLFPDRAVDHIFFRLPAGWTAGRSVGEASYGSDHRPLLGNLRPPPLGDAW
jgi:endonuclease/exonuclease/phosphatase family metal-dependent hydrolase